MSTFDPAALTACGECCTGCAKKQAGVCPGCIEADGRVPEWAGSGRCRIHACTRKHGVTFCGLCPEFPCGDLETLMPWKKEIVPRFRALAEENLRNELHAHRMATERLAAALTAPESATPATEPAPIMSAAPANPAPERAPEIQAAVSSADEAPQKNARKAKTALAAGSWKCRNPR